MTKLLKKLSGGLAKKTLVWGILFISIAIPNIASADLFGLEDVAYSFIAKVMFGLTWLVEMIFGVVILILGYILQIVLALNMGVVNSDVVRVGFPVALSFANLAFVLGIIVIAIATILNMESYGIKSLLWKLLTMAIVINFGLIIAGSILRVSDNITLFLVRSTLPGGPQEDDRVNLSQFASTFAAAFNPQQSKLLSITDINTQKEIRDLQSAFSATGQVTGAMLKPILALFLSIGVSMIMTIVVGGLIVMLFYRYIMLALLLVGLPLAWAAWPFPNLKKHFTNWWDKFLKQAFFPPIVIFFLWLSVTVAQALGSRGAPGLHLTTVKDSGGFWGAITNFFGGLLSPLVDSFVSAVVLGGIMIAGIIAAEKFGAMFAKNTLAAVKEGGKGVQKRVLERAGRRVGQAKGKLQQGAAAFGAGALRLSRPITTLANKPLFGTSARRSQILLDAEGKAIKREVGFDTAGNRGIQQEVAFDNKGNTFANWKKNEKGEYLDQKGNKIDIVGTMNAYVTAEGKVIKDSEIIGTFVVPVTVNNQILSDDVLDTKTGKPRKTVEIDGKTTAWVDSKGRLVNAPAPEKAIAGLTAASVAGKRAAEALREQAQFDKGVLSDVFGNFAEGVTKGYKGSSAHDKALKNIKDALKALEGGHAPEETPTGGGSAPGGTGGATPH